MKVDSWLLVLRLAEMMVVLHVENGGNMQKPCGGNDVGWRILLTSMDVAEVRLCFHSKVVGVDFLKAFSYLNNFLQ